MTVAPTHWLLLRGIVREQRHWCSLPEVLERTLAGSRAHTLDLAGAGTEHRRAVPTTVAGITADVRARWLALRARVERAASSAGAARRAAWGLLGVSLGGMVAMQWASAFPGDFARVVLVNTSARDVGRPWERMAPVAATGVVRAALARDAVARERIVLELTAPRVARREEIARRWAEIAATAPVARRALAAQLLAALRFRAPPALPVPALVLVGAADRLASPACGRALAARYGAPLREHPEAGHDLGNDDPEWVAAQLAAWCAS
jgi:pimeloyl-ACP methyl ester carboxylesterase